MKRHLFFIIFPFILLINQLSFAQDITGRIGKLSQSAFSIPIKYICEGVSNFSGGLAQGSEALGYGTLGVGFDTEKAKLWKGGSFYIEGAFAHGGAPSADYIGDLQTASNIEIGGDHVYLQKMYYSQNIGSFFCSLGLLDFGDTFSVCEGSQCFHNSSFGVHSVLSYNMPAPIFPITALGAYMGVNFNDKWSLTLGAYDGNPKSFIENPYNLIWGDFGASGLLTTAEVAFNTDRGSYKLNGYYHTGLYKLGGSLIISQTLLSTKKNELGFFFYGALAEKHNNILYSDVNLGFTLKGLFGSKDKDVLGIGVASSFFVNNHRETAIELVYSIKPTSWLSVEPDFQYIIDLQNDKRINGDAMVARLRLVVEL